MRLSATKRWQCLGLASAVVFCGVGRVAGDSTMDSTEHLLRKALVEARETPLTKIADAGQVITALRMAKDKDLLPYFEKLRESKSLENQIYGMISAAVLTKDAKQVDLPLLFSSDDVGLIGSAVSTLISDGVLTDAQLEKVATDAPVDIQQVMGLGELQDRGKMKDSGRWVKMLRSPQDVVRYYAAISILQIKDSPEAGEAMAALKQMSGKYDLQEAAKQASMVVRVQKEKITAAEPWVVQIASDEKCDERLRSTAVQALLMLHNPEGPRILADMIQKSQDIIEQVKLGLIAIEGGTDLKPGMVEPLVQSRSGLVKSLGELAKQKAEGQDIGPGLLKLIQMGHPIVLDWALGYSEHGEAAERLELRKAIIEQSKIVDGAREKDYERAAVAAERVLEDNGAEGRKLIALLVKSDNRAVVEAVLAGIFRSGVENETELVLPVWDSLSKSSSQETAANYAALILAKEGRKEPLAWLSGMVLGGTVQNPGFRGLAGWYYAKLLGQEGEVLKVVLAE